MEIQRTAAALRAQLRYCLESEQLIPAVSQILRPFLTVMTLMLEDVHSKLNQQLCKTRVPGTHPEEVTCADDTTCFFTDKRDTRQFVQAVDKGFRSGLKPNKHESELTATHQNTHIHFGEAPRFPK